MDDFVRGKLNEWGLSEWTERFKDHGIDKECFFCLDEGKYLDKLITKIGPCIKFKAKLRLLKETENSANHERGVVSSPNQQQANEDTANQAQFSPSTTPSLQGKRHSDLQGESSKWESPTKRRCDATAGSDMGIQNLKLLLTEEHIPPDVKDIMNRVRLDLPKPYNKLNRFLNDKILDLETDKREMVGVFGKTGAGKSSLINAVIEVKNLLPSGRGSACTSVMIKVEGNMRSTKYEAEIEFITKEDWKEELWFSLDVVRDHKKTNDQDNDEDYRDTVEKLSALYGEEWKDKTLEMLMDAKYYREIPEFLNSNSKTLTCESAKELSAKLIKYTRSDSGGKNKDIKKWYWPLVKCVTIRVPKNDLLQHVTIIDLPGNGDRNKSRDEMWKTVVGNCSTVWIVTEMNRPIDEKEPWEILERASSIMGNGGECHQIHFICTKSDIIDDSHEHSSDVRTLILSENKQVKDKVRKEFNNLKNVKKHFKENCLTVFTVSSKEFLKHEHLQPDETEIPKLQELLQNLNDGHSQALNYVSGAYGILSLIKAANCRDGDVTGKKADVCNELEKKLIHEHDRVQTGMKESYQTFEKCLSEGVAKSKTSCENDLKSVINSPGINGRGFHRTLKCVVENGGTHKPKKGKEININATLALCLTDSINEEFKKTFPNERKEEPFHGVIGTISLDTEKLIEKYKEFELQLTFIKTEEDKLKAKLHKIIRERKKVIYRGLTGTIEEQMKECYEEAKPIEKEGALDKMRKIIQKHVQKLKFQEAADEMLRQLKALEEKILMMLMTTMQESIEHSFKTDGDSIPDLSKEFGMVKRYYNDLKGERVKAALDMVSSESPHATF